MGMTALLKSAKQKATLGMSYCVSDYWYTVTRFARTFGHIPNLHAPKTFNEKVNWRKLYDRRPIFRTFADKFEVRQYIKERVGTDILINILQVADKPESINYKMLPSSFIIKATHGSGWNKIIRNKNQLSRQAINRYFRPLLRTDYYRLGREWCYKGIPPRLMVEELLVDADGNGPRDYKFFCFDGAVKFLQIDFDRFTRHTRNLYDANFNPIECQYGYTNHPIPASAPDNFTQLKQVAEALSKGIDFVRVDLYSINNQVYFGELTNYPENGFMKFKPSSMDLVFGEYWHLDLTQDKPAPSFRPLSS